MAQWIASKSPPTTGCGGSTTEVEPEKSCPPLRRIVPTEVSARAASPTDEPAAGEEVVEEEVIGEHHHELGGGRADADVPQIEVVVDVGEVPARASKERKKERKKERERERES